MLVPLKSQPQSPYNGGFTFIEIIAALAILAMLIAIFGMGLTAAMEGYHFSKSNVDLVQKGQLSMARICRELTELIELNDARGGQNPFVVYSRLNKDMGGLPTKTSFALYFDSGNHLLRLYSNVPSNWDEATLNQGDIIIDRIDTFSLQYYKDQLDWIWGIDDLNTLSTIRITLGLFRPDNPGNPQTFTTLVHLRNIGSQGGAAP